MTLRTPVLATALLLAVAVPARAQTPAGPLTPDRALRGVPAGTPTGGTLPLSIADAISRGLEHNLAAIAAEGAVHDARGARLDALADLLPHVSGTVRESRQVINTAAFGFSFPGLPSLIGPFDLFDARLAVSAPLVDLEALGTLRAGNASLDASLADARQARETVVLAVGNLYLLALADQARVESAQAQVETAEALVQMARDQLEGGLIPRVDLLRQQVQLETARAQAIAADNQLAKRRLQLARAIGLPPGQDFTLTGALVDDPAPAITEEAAVQEGVSHRADIAAARARVTAARATRRSAAAARLPSLHLDADVGKLGPTLDTAEKTYNLAASVHVPIFEGGRTQARVVRADATLRQREAELADLESGLHYEVSAALLDLQAARAGLDVATSAKALAGEELTQAQDRFRAGVANTIELVQAQEAVARSSEQYISSLYAYTIAKVGVARAMGDVEQRFLALVGGHP